MTGEEREGRGEKEESNGRFFGSVFFGSGSVLVSFVFGWCERTIESGPRQREREIKEREEKRKRSGSEIERSEMASSEMVKRER